jgi:hypothetical protein
VKAQEGLIDIDRGGGESVICQCRHIEETNPRRHTSTGSQGPDSPNSRFRNRSPSRAKLLRWFRRLLFSLHVSPLSDRVFPAHMIRVVEQPWLTCPSWS